ncbi:antitoxin VbhA family protein [Stenoxybacter acetivorans]|uniref:antitoxin VbhA family protein n=1 Tax=Stenoxybacter acetivorans TaxID=422441 RepID=UPI00056792D3|nr:antitoxin VbhA family protein [Stenoxybacter acetivorans]
MTEIERMKENMRQADAIFALEGFEATEYRHAINAALLDGRVTRAQIIKELLDYANKYKTADGFTESRTWI